MCKHVHVLIIYTCTCMWYVQLYMKCHKVLTPLTEVHSGKICEKSKSVPCIELFDVCCHHSPVYFSSHHTKNCSWSGIYCTPNITFKGVNCLLNGFLFKSIKISKWNSYSCFNTTSIFNAPVLFSSLKPITCMHVHVLTFIKNAYKQDVIHVLMFRELRYKAECNICIAQLIQNYRGT